MKAVILSGGQGTRLQPVTGGAIPKPMAPLAGRPVLEHLLRRLAWCGVKEVCCTLQCLPEQIEDYFGDGSALGLHLVYRREEQPLGTAGAVKNCRDFYGGEPFFVLSGDGVFDFDIGALMDAHCLHGSTVTMALCPQSAPLSYGLAVTDRQGFIRCFVEKPDWGRVVTDLVNTGIYVLSPAALELVPDNTPFDFARDLFPRLLERGEKLYGLPMNGYWRDIGDPESYYQANLDALQGRLHLLPWEDAPAQQSPEQSAPATPKRRRHYRYTVTIPAPERARLMRALSERLMEAGADFSDGLSLADEPGGVHIAAAPDQPGVNIESDDPQTLQRYETLAREMDIE